MALVGVSLLEVDSRSHAALHRSVEWVTFNALIRSLGFCFPTCGVEGVAHGVGLDESPFPSRMLARMTPKLG